MIVAMTSTSSSARAAAILTLVAAGVLAPAGAASAASAPDPVVVDYAASDEVIANPERGFDHTTNTHYYEDGTGYTPLDPATLAAYRSDEGITEIVRVFYLEKFTDQPVLDPAYLALVQADFDTARAAGIGMVPRFAYVQGGDYPYEPPYGDAPVEIALGHIEQLGPILRANSDVITTVQAGFIGLWGEWYYTDYFVADPADPGVVTDADWANRRAVVQALLRELPEDRTLQLRTMQMKQVIQGVPTGAGGALTDAQAYDGSDLARIGHHNDCFLASPDDFGTFLSDPITLDQEYLAADTRFVPMGGETCAVNPPRSEFASAAAEMERYHYSYLNTDYNQDVLDSWGPEGIEETAKRLGYRFVLTQSRAQGSAIEIDVRNEGWAAPYNPRPAELVLTGDAGEFRVPFESDARTWAAGATTTVEADACALPAGEYTAALALPADRETTAQNPLFAIRTANTGTWDATAGTNTLAQTLVSTGSCAAPAGVGSGAAGAELAATGSAAGGVLAAGAAASVLLGYALLRRRTPRDAR